MAFIDSHRFDGFDASDGVTYFPGRVAFAEPSKTEAFARHLSRRLPERTFRGRKWQVSPGPVHRFELQVKVERGSKEAAVAALEHAVSVARTAIVAGTRWYFTAAGSQVETAADVCNVTSEVGDYIPSADGRWETRVVFLIETAPGWRKTTSVVATASGVTDIGYLDIIAVEGDMDADTDVLAVPAQTSNYIALALRSGTDHDASLVKALSPATSNTMTVGGASIGTTDSLDVEKLRGTWAIFGKVQQPNATPANTTYLPRSLLTFTDPVDTASVTALPGVLATVQNAYERLHLGEVVIPCQETPGVEVGAPTFDASTTVCAQMVAGYDNVANAWNVRQTFLLPRATKGLKFAFAYGGTGTIYRSQYNAATGQWGTTLADTTHNATASLREWDASTDNTHVFPAGVYEIVLSSDAPMTVQRSIYAPYTGGQGFRLTDAGQWAAGSPAPDSVYRISGSAWDDLALSEVVSDTFVAGDVISSLSVYIGTTGPAMTVRLKTAGGTVLKTASFSGLTGEALMDCGNLTGYAGQTLTVEVAAANTEAFVRKVLYQADGHMWLKVIQPRVTDIDYHFRVRGQQAIYPGATVDVIAANTGGGVALINAIHGLPFDEAFIKTVRSFAAGAGVLARARDGFTSVYAASATGYGASLAYRSTSVGTDRVGSLMLRPGDNRVHLLSNATAAVAGDSVFRVEHWPTYRLPPGV